MHRRFNLFFFFFNDTATTEIYTLSLHDALPILISIPIATGTLDASQKAATKTSTLRIFTSGPVLPTAVPSNGLFSNANYVLLRESESRYWLFRIGDQYAYSIAKSDVLYIRY